MSKIEIPFNKPTIMGKEKEYIIEAVQRGHISGDGYFTGLCQQFLEKYFHKVLLTTSCTHALEISAMLLGLRPGDEVIVPSFTFVSTANAFALRGARTVFADIHPDTFNLNEKLIEPLITPRTRAVVPVHYAGVGCNMDEILRIAREHKLAVIEDNAHGLFGLYKNNYLGTFGDLATLSFHETKNFHCGEGGALLINKDHFIERAEILREKGTDRSRYFRGQVDKYTWVDIGSSYVLSDILAAYLYAQLEKRELILQKRKKVWEFYHSRLQGWARKNDVRLPVIPSECSPSYHMFYVILPGEEQRDRLMGFLREKGILSVFHYLPLHLSSQGKKLGGKAGDCPVTESLCGRLLRLPFYNDMSGAELNRVADAVEQFKF